MHNERICDNGCGERGQAHLDARALMGVDVLSLHELDVLRETSLSKGNRPSQAL
jgi:hypothetical protein